MLGLALHITTIPLVPVKNTTIPQNFMALTTRAISWRLDAMPQALVSVECACRAKYFGADVASCSLLPVQGACCSAFTVVAVICCQIIVPGTNIIVCVLQRTNSPVGIALTNTRTTGT